MEDKLKTLKDKINDRGGKALVVTGDVTTKQEQQR